MKFLFALLALVVTTFAAAPEVSAPTAVVGRRSLGDVGCGKKGVTTGFGRFARRVSARCYRVLIDAVADVLPSADVDRASGALSIVLRPRARCSTGGL